MMCHHLANPTSSIRQHCETAPRPQPDWQLARKRSPVKKFKYLLLRNPICLCGEILLPQYEWLRLPAVWRRAEGCPAGQGPPAGAYCGLHQVRHGNTLDRGLISPWRSFWYIFKNCLLTDHTEIQSTELQKYKSLKHKLQKCILQKFINTNYRNSHP